MNVLQAGSARGVVNLLLCAYIVVVGVCVYAANSGVLTYRLGPEATQRSRAAKSRPTQAPVGEAAGERLAALQSAHGPAWRALMEQSAVSAVPSSTGLRWWVGLCGGGGGYSGPPCPSVWL